MTGNKIEAPSCNLCCSGKAMSIAQPDCVYVVLGIRQATRMQHIAMCGLLRSTVFFHIIKNMTRFEIKIY